MLTEGETFNSLLHESGIGARFCRQTKAWHSVCAERPRVCALNDGLEKACVVPRSTLGQVMERPSLVFFVYKKRILRLFRHRMATRIKSAKASGAPCHWKRVTASGSLDRAGILPVPVLMLPVYVFFPWSLKISFRAAQMITGKPSREWALQTSPPLRSGCFGPRFAFSPSQISPAKSSCVPSKSAAEAQA